MHRQVRTQLNGLQQLTGRNTLRQGRGDQLAHSLGVECSEACVQSHLHQTALRRLQTGTAGGRQVNSKLLPMIGPFQRVLLATTQVRRSDPNRSS